MTILHERRVCVLHIGVHKTGSTSIQNALYRSRQPLLEKYGIYYQEYDQNLTSAVRSIFQPHPERYHANVKIGANTPELAARQNEIHLRRIKKDLKKSSQFHTVLSAEGFSALRADEVKAFMKLLRKYHDNIRVVVYARHLIDWVSSSIQETLKMGKPIPEVLTKNRIGDYKNKLEPWINVIGKDKIHIRDFGDAQKLPLGVLSDFCGLLGVDENDLIMEGTDRANTGFSQEGADLLNTLNTLRPYHNDEKNKISDNRVVNDANYFKSVAGRKFNLPASAFERVRGIIDRDTAWLKQEFGFEFSERREVGDHKETYGSETRESLALLISDLINDWCDVKNEMLFAQAKLLWSQKKPVMAINRLESLVKTSPYDTKARKKLKQYERIRYGGSAKKKPNGFKPADKTDKSSKTRRG